jgi:S1-C subfamily serine protease
VAGQNVPIPRRIVRFYQLPVDSGVLLVSFETNGKTSAAKEAGLLAGDIVIEFDGYPIRGIDDLHKLLTDERIGRGCPVTIIRGVQKLTFDVVPQMIAD